MKLFTGAIKYITVCLLAGLLGSCVEDKNSLCLTGVLYLNVEEDATLYTKAQTGVTFESASGRCVGYESGYGQYI